MLTYACTLRFIFPRRLALEPNLGHKNHFWRFILTIYCEVENEKCIAWGVL